MFHSQLLTLSNIFILIVQSSALRQLTRQRVEMMRQQLEERLGEEQEVRITTRMVRASNMWEVVVGGRTVHSRKRGEGYVDSPSKIDKIARAVLSAPNNS